MNPIGSVIFKKRYCFVFMVLQWLFFTTANAQNYNISNTSVTTCSGNFYDSGGSGGTYGNNQNFTFTICSNNGQSPFLTFSAFALENNWDFLYIYNGPSTASPLIGTYTGTNNPGTVTATGTCITIRFTSDGSVTMAGWAASIGCGTPPPPPPPPPGPAGNCANANPFCTGTNYSFPASTGTTAQAGPNYGCLFSQPNPAWYYLQVQNSGTFNITMSNSGNFDIDFALWGPFSTLTNVCNNLTGTPISCSYSSAATETASIPNAVAGQFYVLVITNFSNQPTNISFSQTGGTGTTNCNILCNMTAFTAVPSACNPVTNKYTITGSISFTFPPTSGTLTVTNSCGGSVNIPQPWVSPLTYTITNVTPTGGPCTVTAVFSADPLCTLSQNITSPPPCNCSVAPTNNGPRCVGSTVTFTTPAVTGATSYSWAGPNGFSAIGQTVAIPNVTAAAAGTYTVTATGTNLTCSGTTTLVINPTPVVTATNSGPHCVNQNLTLTASGAASYLWSGPSGFVSANQNPFINNVQVTNSGVYTVSGTSAAGCVGTATTNVVVNPNLNLNVSSNSPQCVGSSLSLNVTPGATWSWTGPNGFTSVTQNPTINSLTLAASGTYSVSATDVNGCTGSGTVAVQINPLPTVTVNNNGPICQGQTLNLFANGGTLYSWTGPNSFNSSSQNPVVASATIVHAGTYSVVVTDANGCQNSDVTTVVVNPSPAVTVNSPAICQGSIATLTASGAFSYTWTGNLSSTVGASVTASPTITTTYSVTGQDVNGCTTTVSSTVTVNNNPVVDAGNQDTICSGTSANLLATGATNYVWNADPSLSSTSISNPTVNPSSTTTYFVTGTDQNGCTGSDQVTIVVATPFTISTSFTDATCNNSCNGTASVVTAPANSGFTPYTIVWSNATVGSNANGLCTGNYSVFVSDIAGCVQTAVVTVSQPSAFTLTVTNVTDVTCNGGNNGSATISTSGGTGTPSVVSWTPSGPTGFNPSSLTAGTYTLVAQDANQCQATTTVNIVQPLAVAITNPVAQNICLSQNATLGTVASGGNGVYFYTWTDGTNTFSTNPITVSPTTTTSYSLVVIDGNGCISTTQPVTTVTVASALLINPIANAEICFNDETTLNASGSGGDGNYQFIWSPNIGITPLNANSSSAEAGPNSTLTYTVTMTDGCNSPSVNTTVTVTVNQLPIISVTPPTTSGCEPFSTSFSATSNSGISSCSWNLGNGQITSNCNPSMTYPNAGTYNVVATITDDNGCVNTGNANVFVFANPVAEFYATPQPTTVLDPDVQFVNFSAGSGLSSSSYQWNFGDAGSPTNLSNAESPMHIFENAGTYIVTLTATTIYGCIDTVSHVVVIEDDFALYIPNAFTPNNDRTNDIFRADGIGISEFEMTIYNRWGNKVFSSEDINEGWDGKGNSGEPVQQDVYVYKIIVTNFKKDKKQYTGQVSLIR